MSYIDTLKEKLENREKIYSTMLCHVGFTLLPRIYKANGLDMMVMDLEHGSFYPENIGDFCMACHAAELPVIVRVQDCEYHCISKPIDMGADGVQVFVLQLCVAQRIKVTIAALTSAEGHVDINTQGGLMFSCKNRHRLLRS